MIKVLIVDDSLTTMEYLKYLLGSDGEIMISGIAGNGKEAVELSKKNQPDVILMDIHMPKMDGFEATRIIMENNPVPIIVMSASYNVKDTSVVFRAMEAGAVALSRKPPGIGHPDHEVCADELLTNVKLMSEVKVVTRRGKKRTAERAPGPELQVVKPVQRRGEISVIAIGASAGGPPVLQTILSQIPGDFAAPILIVQHISTDFVEGMIEWLSQTTQCPLHVATQGEVLLPGHVYFSADDHHMSVGNSGRIVLSREEPENGIRPAISFLFRSVARVFGPNAAGVLLTGMGKDGAEELKLMKDQGAVTIIQDKESSLVHGMAGVAKKLDAAIYELPPEDIAAALISLVNQKQSKRWAYESPEA